MNPRSPIRKLRPAALVALGLLLPGLAGAGTPAPASGPRPVQAVQIPLAAQAGPLGASGAPRIPRPCFVPANPRKLGIPPRLTDPLRLPDGAQIPTGTPFDYRADHLLDTATPPDNDLHAIVILVDFDDQEMGTGFQAAVSDSIQLYFNRVMLFLSQTYDEMSGGVVHLTWDLTPVVYRLPHPMSYYGADDSLATREAALCQDAVQAADPDVNFSQYNRYLLFHAGAGQEADINDDSRNEIWSVFFRQIDFQYWLDAPDAAQGIRTEDGNAATPFYVNHMTLLPEVESQDGYEFGILGVVAHEFGHSFGLPDLYDTTAPQDFIYADSQGIGAFGLMGAGIWNDDGFFPAEMCAWSKFYVGWLRPRIVEPDATGGTRQESLTAVEIDRFGGAVRIPMGGDEYLLIANRLHDTNRNGRLDFDDADDDSTFDFWTDSYAGAEFDWYLPQELVGQTEPGEDGSGLLIWHIDESVIRENLIYNLVNAEALHKGVDLEEADGIQDLDKLEFSFEAFGDPKDSFWAPYFTEFTPYTTPSTEAYFGAYTGIWITGVSGPGQTMTMNLRFEDPGVAARGFRAGWPRDLPARARDFQPVTGDLDGDGTQEILLGATDDAGNGGPVVLRADGTPFLAGASPYASWGKLHAEPILANLDGSVHPGPEMIWVSGDSVYARRGDGLYLDRTGAPVTGPAPYFVLPAEPGRLRLSVDYLEPRNSSPACGLGPGGDVLPEILLGVPSATVPGSSDLLAIAYPEGPGLETEARVTATLPGDASGYVAVADVDSIDGGLMEMATSVHRPEGGYLAVTLYDHYDPDVCRFSDVRTVAFAPGDSVNLTDPVIGDLNRDGLDDIVVADSQGWVHVLSVRVQTADGTTKEPGPSPDPVSFDNSRFQELQGWPVYVGTLDGDALSLADVDLDGFLEVLVFGGGNVLNILNYNGTSILTLPVAVPAEDRFTAPYLSPLVLDVTGDAGMDLVLPLPDGQVRAHDLLGRPLDGWSFPGGGNQGGYPVFADLDGDGTLEMTVVEDLTASIPTDGVLDQGDQSPGIPKRGRVSVRELGSGNANGPWPGFRHDAARTGRAPLSPVTGVTEPSGLLAEAFVVPNPVVHRATAGFHYRIRSTVETVKIEIYDALGTRVNVLDGTVFPSIDNLVEWNLTNDRGNDVAPGIYVARLQAESGTRVDVQLRKFVIAR